MLKCEDTNAFFVYFMSFVNRNVNMGSPIYAMEERLAGHGPAASSAHARTSVFALSDVTRLNKIAEPRLIILS